MFDHYFCPRVAARLRASPDAAWLGSFLEVLDRRGHARLTVQVYLRGAVMAAAAPPGLDRSHLRRCAGIRPAWGTEGESGERLLTRERTPPIFAGMRSKKLDFLNRL
jgi:hypothetical protein